MILPPPSENPWCLICGDAAEPEICSVDNTYLSRRIGYCGKIRCRQEIEEKVRQRRARNG